MRFEGWRAYIILYGYMLDSWFITRKFYVENQLELVIDAKATLGEGPCWDNDKQLLYWVDIMEMYISIIPNL